MNIHEIWFVFCYLLVLFFLCLSSACQVRRQVIWFLAASFVTTRGGGSVESSGCALYYISAWYKGTQIITLTFFWYPVHVHKILTFRSFHHLQEFLEDSRLLFLEVEALIARLILHIFQRLRKVTESNESQREIWVAISYRQYEMLPTRCQFLQIYKDRMAN